MKFTDVFFVRPGDEPEPDSEPEIVRPAWFCPPDDELGMCLPSSMVVGRSDRAVVALRSLTAYSTGVSLELLAAGRGLRASESNRLFHEQHLAGVEEGVPDGFLRVGIEYEDETRVSNLLDRRRLWRPDSEPEGPVLIQAGGGGGQAGSGHVTMNPGYWLWPVPPPGRLVLFVEWPALGVTLASAELDGAAIVAAAGQSQPLWAD